MKIYLDTSVFSALFDERNPERQALTKDFFSVLNRYEVYISDLTIIEIEKTPDEILQDKMKEKIKENKVLTSDDNVQRLAEEYIKFEAVSEKYFADAFHIAVAVVNDLDIIVSWNFRHIVRRKTKDIVSMVNTKNNMKHIEIVTPAELL